MADQSDDSTTLPEVLVVGDPNRPPTTVADWFAEGFYFGWNNQGVTPEPPAPLDTAYLQAYFDGAKAAGPERVSFDNYDGPAIGPGIRGEPFDDFQKRLNTELEKWLHSDDPHSETDHEIEVEIGPGVP